jgi:hypothetical protein
MSFFFFLVSRLLFVSHFLHLQKWCHIPFLFSLPQFFVSPFSFIFRTHLPWRQVSLLSQLSMGSKFRTCLLLVMVIDAPSPFSTILELGILNLLVAGDGN